MEETVDVATLRALVQKIRRHQPDSPPIQSLDEWAAYRDGLHDAAEMVGALAGYAPTNEKVRAICRAESR